MKTFIVSFFSLWLIVVSGVRAEPLKIVVLESMPVPVVTEHSVAITTALNALQEQGALSFKLEILKAQGDRKLAAQLLEDSLKEKSPALVITVATLATQVAKKVLSGTGIPILFCVVADPVGSGIVEKIGVATDTNISGLVYTQLRVVKIEMVMRLLRNTPYAEKVTFGVICSDYPSSVGDLKKLQEVTALSENIKYIVYSFPYKPVPKGIPDMFAEVRHGLESLKGKIDFLWEVPGPLAELGEYSSMLLDSGIPVILANTQKGVELGALIAVPTDYSATAQEISEMASELLNGRDIGTIAVTSPKKFKLFLNMKTAERLGITVPSHLLMIAGDNLYY